MNVKQIIKEEIQKYLFELELPKKKWLKVTDKNTLKQLKNNLFNLIQIAYKPIGGHLKFKTPNDVLSNDLNYSEIIDIDNDSDVDAVIFGKKQFGTKQSGLGHDGNSLSKKELLKHKSDLLKKHKHWVEVSGIPAEIYINKYNIPVLSDENLVKKLLKNKDIAWKGKISGKPGDGWYERSIAGQKHNKIIVGIPKI